MRRASLAVLVLVGCGLPPPDLDLPAATLPVDAQTSTLDLPGGGWIAVAFDESTGHLPGWTHARDFSARLLLDLDVSARYWGGSIRDLAGWTVVLRGGFQVACLGASSVGGVGFWGCAHQTGSWIDLAAGETVSVEQTALIHEVGHAVLFSRRGDGDDCHTDPRWQDFGPVAAELRADGVSPVMTVWWRESPSCG
jgi:hypothetical protein